MRILIYLEPHPIRDSFTLFLSIGRQFAAMLNLNPASLKGRIGHCDARIYGNRETLENLSKGHSGIDPFLIWPKSEEQALFQSYSKDWTTEGMREWIDLIRGDGDICRAYQNVLEEIYRRFRFDILVHWGDNGAVKAFTDTSDTARVTMELGCTRPPFFDSIVFDPLGANGSTFPSHASLPAILKSVGRSAWPAAADLLAFSETLEARAYEGAVRPTPFPGRERLLTRGSRPAVFLPLQLHDDANLLVYSDFATPADVVERTVAPLADHGFVSVVKPHPASLQRPGGAAALEAAQDAALSFRDRVVWVDHKGPKVDNSELFGLTDGVVTVNSSVGFESLYFEKPLCVLGSATYRPLGLFPRLEDFVAGNFSFEEYRRNIAALRAFFLRAYLIDSVDAFQYATFIERVIGAVELKRTAQDDPDRMVSVTYNKYADDRLALRRNALRAGIPWNTALRSSRSAKLAVSAKPPPASITRAAIALVERIAPGPAKGPARKAAVRILDFVRSRISPRQREKLVRAYRRLRGITLRGHAETEPAAKP
jgi:hypothetical protein